MREKRLTLAVLAAILVVAAVGLATVSQEQNTRQFEVTAHPTDNDLQREDAVIVSDQLAEFEHELRLLTHRVDALRDGDTTTHRIEFRLGSQDTSTTRDASRLVRLRGRELDTIGIEGQSGGVPDSTATAYTRLSPGSPNVTIVLPKPGRVPELGDTSYSFLVVHELAGIPLDRPTVTTGGEQRVTTDRILARRGVSEGAASHLGAEYIERYGGTFESSIFRPKRDDHPHDRIVQWTYYEGYEFAEVEDVTESEDALNVRSTRALLTPSVDDRVRGLPNSSFAERLDGVSNSTYTDRPGPLVVRTTLTSRGVSLDRAHETVVGWRNGRVDRYLVEGTIVSTWTTVWANETAATDFVSIYETNVPVTRAESFDREQCVSAERLLLVDDRRVTVVRCS